MQDVIIWQGQRGLRCPPRRLMIEYGNRLARRHHTADQLLRHLEECLDRPHHEDRVTKEADQLSDSKVSGNDLTSSKPGQSHQEQPENSTLVASTAPCHTPAETAACRVCCDWPA